MPLVSARRSPARRSRAGYQLFADGARRGASSACGTRRRAADRATPLPPVTVLKPLKGPGIDLYDEPRELLPAGLPEYQIVFGVEDTATPRWRSCSAICARLPDLRHRPLGRRRAGREPQGREPGAHDAARPARRAGDERRDIRVRPDYLRDAGRPAGPTRRWGSRPASTAAQAVFGLPSVLESLFINTDFLPMVLMAQWVQRFRTPTAPRSPFRREALDAHRRLRRPADHLADDYHLGNRIARRGLAAACCCPTSSRRCSTRAPCATSGAISCAGRARIASCQPFGWFVVAHRPHDAVGRRWRCSPPAARPSAGSRSLAAVVTRLGALRVILGMLGDTATVRELWLVPLKDLAYSAVWMTSWLGRDVVWSGQRLRVLPDGRMLPLDAVSEPALPSKLAAPSR